MAGVQDKSKEINFFKTHAQSDDYDVFHPETNDLLIDTFERICTPARGEIVADLGCGSGIFTKNLQTRGFSSVGMDLCVELLALQLFYDFSLHGTLQTQVGIHLL